MSRRLSAVVLVLLVGVAPLAQSDDGSTLRCDTHLFRGFPEYVRQVQFKVEGNQLIGEHVQNERLGSVEWRLSAGKDSSEFIGTYKNNQAEYRLTRKSGEPNTFEGFLINPRGQNIRQCTLVMSAKDLETLACVGESQNCRVEQASARKVDADTSAQGKADDVVKLRAEMEAFKLALAKLQQSS